jgi:NAD(P)H dehydrogenase (quinone)
MTTVLDTPVQYQPVTADQYQAILTGAGLDEGTAGFLTALDTNMAAGIMAYASDDLTRLIAHRSMSLTEGLSQ